MGTTNLEGSMRAALATAELDDADLRQLYVELTSIKTDALDPAGRRGAPSSFLHTRPGHDSCQTRPYNCQ